MAARRDGREMVKPGRGSSCLARRQGVIEALLALDADSVVFTHFIAINVVVGAATGDDRVACFWPDNGSITIVEADGSSLSLIERGDEPVGWF
jgi:broad specificity phosphatase PhoE